MAAVPVAGEADSPLQNADQLIDDQHTPVSASAEADFTVSQLASSQTPNPNSGGVTTSLGKRKISKPVRYCESSIGEQRTRSPSQINFRGNSATKSSGILPAMIRAGKIQSSLGIERPSCIKMVVKAHIDPGYWMGFSQWYGKLFLPKKDCEMEIEAANGEIHHIKYIADKAGFSAGWKNFAVESNLNEGDVMVFHLVKPNKFKVYVVRVDGVDDAVNLPNLEPNTNQTDNTPSPNSNKSLKMSTPPLMEQSGNNSEEEVSRPTLSFEELNNFKDFHIMVKGVCIDSELPDDVRMNYYKLCMSRKEFLHDSLPDNLYNKLVVGMIGETVRIANEVKNCKFATTKEEFETWDNSLNSFAILGMKVGFLRDRISTLLKIVVESESDLDFGKYLEAKREQKRAECELVRLTRKLVDLKEVSGKFKDILEGLKQNVGKHEAKFQDELDVPW